MQAAVVSAEELERLLARDFPESFYPGCGWTILAVWHGGSRVHRAFQENITRPGGTISGATMMTLADLAMYVAVLGSIGWEPLAVTTSLNINFLKKPAPGALIGECRLLKLGPAPRRRRSRDPPGRGGGVRRARHLDLFDPAAARVDARRVPSCPFFILHDVKQPTLRPSRRSLGGFAAGNRFDPGFAFIPS